MATLNAANTYNCWPHFGEALLAEQPRDWRMMLSCFIDANPCPPPEQRKAQPAGIFNICDPHSTRTNVYAILGEGAVFSPEFSRRFFVDVPQKTLLYVSGGESPEPWYDAQDVKIEVMRDAPGSIRDVLGEAMSGVTYLVLKDGEVVIVDSSIPAAVLARQADASDPQNREIAPEIAARRRR